MKKLFIDMDGVLTDFNKHYTKMFGRTPAEVKADRERKEYSEHWHKFVSENGFINLEWHEGGLELVEFLRSIEDRVQLCILTSAGGFDRQREVAAHKLVWLTMHDIRWPAVVVPGRRYKAGFATGDAFIIDDTPDIIKSFCANGGSGILHKDVEETIPVLERWVTPPL